MTLADQVAMLMRDVDSAIRDPQKYVQWRKRFDTLTDTQRSALGNSENDSVSIVAAWETIVRRPKLTDEGAHKRIGSRRAKEFVAFCERRLRFQFPIWYRTLLESGEIDENSVTFSEYGVRPRVIGMDMWTYDGEGIEINAGAIEVASGDHKHRIVLMDRDKGLAHASSKSGFWLSTYQRVPPSATLDCYDFGDDNRQWRVKVWGAVFDLPCSLLNPFHRSQVIRSGRVVYVVGIGSLGTYIEGFDVDDGGIRLRFVGTTLLLDALTTK